MLIKHVGSPGPVTADLQEKWSFLEREVRSSLCSLEELGVRVSGG